MAIDKLVNISKTAVVIGGGLIGIDIAVELINRGGLKVHIVEMGAKYIAYAIG